MKLPIYRGFSSDNFAQNRTFMVTNMELVKRDLLNHIYTIPGERVHLPEFGTRIPLLAFEPLDEKTIQIIREDLKKVFEYDPRVRLIDMAVSAIPDANMIAAFVDLEYLELNTRETFKLEFKTGS